MYGICELFSLHMFFLIFNRTNKFSDYNYDKHGQSILTFASHYKILLISRYI